MQNQETTNPFVNYTLSITDSYQETVIGLMETNNKPKRRAYNSITALLEESFFLGATKYGSNFIA
ncbi:hypothetical protein J6Q66_02255 [bacterium]|nr:hypothetical protein [bacterium]